MARSLARLARLGFVMTPIPDTSPQRWYARDLLTGEVEELDGLGVGNWLCGWNLCGAFDARLREATEQGKTNGETADMFGLGWDTVVYHRRRLGLPANEPRGSRRAWQEQRRTM